MKTTWRPAREAGSCNSCSFRDGDVLEVELGAGRLTFRPCLECAQVLASLLGIRLRGAV